MKWAVVVDGFGGPRVVGYVEADNEEEALERAKDYVINVLEYPDWSTIWVKEVEG